MISFNMILVFAIIWIFAYLCINLRISVIMLNQSTQFFWIRMQFAKRENNDIFPSQSPSTAPKLK